MDCRWVRLVPVVGREVVQDEGFAGARSPQQLSWASTAGGRVGECQRTRHAAVAWRWRNLWIGVDNRGAVSVTIARWKVKTSPYS